MTGEGVSLRAELAAIIEISGVGLIHQIDGNGA
jgi:hypothetical protein